MAFNFSLWPSPGSRKFQIFASQNQYQWGFPKDDKHDRQREPDGLRESLKEKKQDFEKEQELKKKDMSLKGKKLGVRFRPRGRAPLGWAHLGPEAGRAYAPARQPRPGKLPGRGCLAGA